MPPAAPAILSLTLVRPTTRLRDSYLRALRAWRAEGLAWHVAVDLVAVEEDFATFVASKRAEAEPADAGALPKTQLWAIADGEIVGRVGIFHRLTEALRLDGGHIGYDTVPAYRGRGVATEMLRQALPFARALGLGEVGLTCDAENLASARVIEKSGGALLPVPGDERARVAKRRYVIALDERHVHAIDPCIARALLHADDDGDDDDDDAYWDAVYALQKLAVDAVWTAIAPLAQHADPHRRALVPNTLRYLGARPQPRLAETIVLLRAMLASPQPDNVLVAIATAFVDLQHPAAPELLRPLVAHPSAGVREAVVHGLLPTAGGAVPELITLSRDAEPSIRDWATFGLGTHLPAWNESDYVDDPERREALWARHDDSDEDARGEALVGLAAMRDERARPLIERALAAEAETETEHGATYARDAAALFAEGRLGRALPAQLPRKPHERP